VNCEAKAKGDGFQAAEKCHHRVAAAAKVIGQSEKVDPRVLTDFRDALNRVRNTAWAAQQCAAASMYESSPVSVSSLLTSERIRAAYQLCCAIHDDLSRDDIPFQ
jgi:hypothetical protein